MELSVCQSLFRTQGFFVTGPGMGLTHISQQNRVVLFPPEPELENQGLLEMVVFLPSNPGSRELVLLGIFSNPFLL